MRRPRQQLRPEMLEVLTMPVLVVLGERDFAGPATPLVDALPNGRLASLRGADHFATPKDVRFLDAGLEFLGVSLP